MASNATKLVYFEDMWKLQSKASLVSCFQEEDGRHALILDSTIFHPQGGGQPYDTGYISNPESNINFIVEDVRMKDGLVFHYGHFDNSGGGECDWKLDKGLQLCLFVDEDCRNLNSRLHSAGHLLDICMRNVGLDLEPGKGYHFPDGPFVEYKGKVQQSELQNKQKELELNANTLISKGGKVYAAVLTYDEASELCGGQLPDYIPKVLAPLVEVVRLVDAEKKPAMGYIYHAMGRAKDLIKKNHHTFSSNKICMQRVIISIHSCTLEEVCSNWK